MNPENDSVQTGLPENPGRTPQVTGSGAMPFCLPSLANGERELAEYFLKTGDEKECASHFKIPALSVQKILMNRNILSYIAMRQNEINESMSLTKDKVLARLNAVLDNRLDASKNLLRGIEIAAKVLGMIRPELSVAVVNASPYAQLTEAELEAEIRKRLEIPRHVNIIDAEVVPPEENAKTE